MRHPGSEPFTSHTQKQKVAQSSQLVYLVAFGDKHGNKAREILLQRDSVTFNFV